MAITLADFNKIWASTSPLTPYSFSESNYKQGWNFIGSTPPARQMWDFLQKNNDEKMKYIVYNYLPLSGGAMTGTTILDISSIYGVSIRQKYDNAAIRFYGGTDDSSANLWLFGKNSAGSGRFDLVANNGSGNKILRGSVDGTLTWNSKRIITVDDIFYKSGDTFTNSANFYVCGMVTAGATDMRVTIPVPKRLDNISSITINSLTGGIRVPTGGYIDTDGTDLKSKYTCTAVKSSDCTVNILMLSSSAITGATNNTPLSFALAVSLTFN